MGNKGSIIKNEIKGTTNDIFLQHTKDMKFISFNGKTFVETNDDSQKSYFKLLDSNKQPKTSLNIGDKVILLNEKSGKYLSKSC